MSNLISILTYVGLAYGLMCIGQACGLANPWLSWIPFANSYQMGAVADHYADRNLNRQTHFRKILLATSIILSVIAFICGIVIGVEILFILADSGADMGSANILLNSFTDSLFYGEVWELIPKILVAVLVPLLIILAVTVVHMVFYYIALHRVYMLVDPKNATVYTVLSIFFSGLATAIIFLVIAKKPPIYPAEGEPREVPPDSFAENTTGGSDTYSI